MIKQAISTLSMKQGPSHSVDKIPPTQDALLQHARWALYQAGIWTACTQSQPVIPDSDNPLHYLVSSSDEEVRLVHISDEGSRSKYAPVQIQGVPAQGSVDRGADISIMGKELFKKVAAVGRLKKKDFKKPDKIPRSYDRKRKPISLDGRLDLDITFDGETVNTPVCLKMDSAEELLLSEGVCRQLHIIRYHSDMMSEKNAAKKSSSDCVVPLTQMRWTQSACVLPNQSRMVAVELEEATVVRSSLNMI